MPPSAPETSDGPRQVREEAYSRLARVEAELHTMALSHHHLEDELLAALRALLARGDELDKVRFWPRLSATNDHRMTTE